MPARTPPPRKAYAPNEPAAPAWRGADRGIDLAPRFGRAPACIGGRVTLSSLKAADPGRSRSLAGRNPPMRSKAGHRYQRPVPLGPPQWTVGAGRPASSRALAGAPRGPTVTALTVNIHRILRRTSRGGAVSVELTESQRRTL